MSYKYLTSLFLLMFFLVFSVLTINADIVSINSGGSDEIIINSNNYIGGFFSCIPDTCTSLGYSCGTWTENCGLILNCGSCSSGQTCSSGNCIATSGATTTTPSVGGGGGGATIGTIEKIELTVNPPELSISVIENVEETRQIKIKNIGSKSISVSIEIIGEDLKKTLTIIKNKTLLKPNEEKTLELKINSKEKKLVTGKILMKYSGFVKEIPIIIGSKSKNFLFDISIYLSDAFRNILIGNKLKAQLNLIQVNNKGKVDVVANYVIKDFEGNNYYKESETFFVLKEKSYVKEFPTQDLPPGKYALGFEISYPGAFAISSTTFNIKEKTKLNNLNIFMLISILIFILIIIFIIIKIKKQNKKNILRKK